jgi:hypothetical protein
MSSALVTTMSSRTAEANRAVREAWYAEKRLVLEGKGTRDWTDEQQRSIAEKGKAYDDRGIAFEGQHMKSVEAYPEYQGDRRNIQFLTKQEHLAAHGGNWQNHTNGYYDPVLKTMSDFGDAPPQPCAEVPLTNPLYAERLSPAKAEATKAETSSPATTAASSSSSASAPAAATPKGNWRQRTQSLKRVAQQSLKDPRVRAAAGSAVLVVGKVALDAVTGDRSSRRVRPSASSTQPSTGIAPDSGTDSLRENRQPPDEHGVSGYTRKDGTSVRPYRRGGKKDSQ